MKRTVRRSLFVAAILAAPLTSSSVLAGDDAPPAAPPPAPATKPAETAATKAVRASFAAMQDAMKSMQAAGADQAKRKEANEALKAKREAFVKLFTACDWEQFAPDVDTELLQNGLSMAGSTALGADDAKTAVRAFESLVTTYPEFAGRVGIALASAYVGVGDVVKAKAALETAVDKADEKMKPYTQVSLGDLLAAQGDLAGAAKTWQTALDAVPATLDPRKDGALANAKSGAEIRLALVGKAAPEIDSKNWVGGEPKALSAFKGSVVVVDFWATWCPPCRDVMPGLNKVYEQRKAAGLVVLGATRFYPGYPGFMPKAGTKDPMRDGAKVDGLTPENLADHLKQFKTNVGITYPFVVMADESESKAYHVTGIPTMAVIDRDGKVAFVKVGSGDESLLKLAVDRLLAAPAK